jgi:cytochrome P450
MANHDPAIFTEPNRFAPERWNGETGKSLNQHMVSFAEGSRRCIGRR